MFWGTLYCVEAKDQVFISVIVNMNCAILH